MSNEKCREEFERTNGRDHLRQPPKGNNYIDPMAQADWESFQKGWAQSREALVIELPEAYAWDNDGGFEKEYDPESECSMSLIPKIDVIIALEASGLKVKP